MLAGLADADWCDRAACRDEEPELFFPERTDKRGNLAAQRVCWQCPVLPECRRWVLAARIKHGVWGGMSEQERDKLRKTAGDR
ncbi:MAG TPA: WhiB family transcriptional regulator [Mycobacterium sp.]|nr:WhiB family transcriptional regulator [Mycobacterium sp.]